MKMTLITLRSLTAKRSEPHPGDSKRQQESGTEFLVVKTHDDDDDDDDDDMMMIARLFHTICAPSFPTSSRPHSLSYLLIVN